MASSSFGWKNTFEGDTVLGLDQIKWGVHDDGDQGPAQKGVQFTLA